MLSLFFGGFARFFWCAFFDIKEERLCGINVRFVPCRGLPRCRSTGDCIGRNLDLKGQTLLGHDLAQEQTYCIADVQAALRQHLGSSVFQIGLDPGTHIGRFERGEYDAISS